MAEIQYLKIIKINFLFKFWKILYDEFEKFLWAKNEEK